MDQHILSAAGRDFFVDQDCHWQVSVPAAQRWAQAHGASAIRLSRRRCTGPGHGFGPAQLIAEIPLAELAGAGPDQIRQRAVRGGA